MSATWSQAAAANTFPAPPAAISCSRAAAGWLRLSMVRGVGPMLGRRLVSACGGIEALWRASPDELAAVPGVGERLVAAISGSRAADAEAVLDTCRQHAISIISPDDPSWPQSLLPLEDAPLLLYVAGDASHLNAARPLAMVGARRAGREGQQLARRWSHYCAGQGVTMISGMAYGIDAEAHAGALEGNGATVAVLGCGLASLGELQATQAAAICKSGCVISEYAPGITARAEHFPRRNRIIAGLAAALVVIEADLRSGSLITARLAADYGREVFAVPGSVLMGRNGGCHQLIRDGAGLADNIDALLAELGWQAGSESGATAARSYAPASPEEATVLAAMGRESIHVDEICQTCGLTLPLLSPILLALELQGVVERLPGSRYQLSVELLQT